MAKAAKRKKRPAKRPGRKPATEAERAGWRRPVSIKLTEAEREVLSRAAAAAGVSLGSYLRDAALEKATGN